MYLHNRNLRKFQRFYGLNQTGLLDQETKDEMSGPRCGLPDSREGKSIGKKRRKWNKKLLTWRVTKVSKITKKEFEGVIDKALAAWASIANIKFQQSSSGSADITASFQPKKHGDGYPFGDKVLAHASLPDGRSLTLHMYDKWNWVLQRGGGGGGGGGRGVAVLDVTTHELGHNLGLNHSPGRGDVMYASSRNKDFTEVTFSAADKKNIQALYGAATGGGGGGGVGGGGGGGGTGGE